MRYIEFKAELTNEINLRSSDNETLRDSISVKCVDFCENNKNGFCVFISNLKGNECRFVIGGNGFNERLSAEGKRFWKSLGLKGKIVSFKEISAEKTMKLMRGRSEISTHFDIEELLKLDSLKSSWFDERIVEISTPTMLKKIGIKRNICELKAEAERISKCNLDRFVGHPVHYIISDNNNESFDNVANVLVGCLVKAKRLESSRIMILDGDNESLSYNCEYIRDMYENMYGGTIIFSIGYSEECEEYADSDAELLENVCKCARRFKNKVLTIFHIGRHDIKRANAIAAYLRDEIALIHFKEDIMSKSESKKYLCALSDEKDISDKSELLKQFEVEIDKCYASDLDRLFNKYYSGYIRSVIYPQYFNINKVEESNPRVKGNAADELNKMIGLDKAKSVIYKTVSFFKLLSLYNERGIEMDPPARSMIFTGNPGTAKTTVARLTAKIYKRETLANKLNALQERYDTYSAEDFQKGVYNCVYNKDSKDFKQTLSYYINYKRYLLDEIRDTDENTIFVLENDYIAKKAYTTLDEAMRYAIIEETCGPFPIIKHKLNSKDGVLRRVFLTSWGEIADITCYDFTYSEYDLQCAYAEIPHKYKIGDIIEYDGKYAVVADAKIKRVKPRYLDHSCHTDMCLFCLRYCEDSLHSCGGSFCHDHFPILETEICSNDELPERYRPLIGLSKLFKGELKTVDFLEMYSNRCLEDLSK